MRKCRGININSDLKEVDSNPYGLFELLRIMVEEITIDKEDKANIHTHKRITSQTWTYDQISKYKLMTKL